MNIKTITMLMLIVFIAGSAIVGVRLVSNPVTKINYAAELACKRSQQWTCALSQRDIQILSHFSTKYRLALYDQQGSLRLATRINDTRDRIAEQTKLLFNAQTGLIYTCKLEVFDESATRPTVCGFIAGRLRCQGTPAGR